jgi:hypothetical protein
MNKKQMLSEFKKFCKKNKYTEEKSERLKAILESKSNDYASKDDVLIGFKRASEYARGLLSPVNIIQALICVKFSRIENLSKVKTVHNESLRDSEDDLDLYIFLLDCVLLEKKKELTYEIN